MNEYKFYGTRYEDGEFLTSTEYVYAENKNEAVKIYISKFKPLPWLWEFLGQV